MDSLGTTRLSDSRRVKNIPISAFNKNNPRNQNSVRNAFQKPVNQAIPISNVFTNIYRDKMNNTDPRKDYSDLLRLQKVTQVEDYRRKDKFFPTPTLPNLRNVTEVNRGRIIFNK